MSTWEPLRIVDVRTPGLGGQFAKGGGRVPGKGGGAGALPDGVTSTAMDDILDDLKPQGVPRGQGTYTNAGYVTGGQHTSAAAARRVEAPMGSGGRKSWGPESSGNFILGQRMTGNVFQGNGRLKDVAGMAEAAYGGDWIMFP